MPERGMRSYRLVLCAEDPAEDADGFVHCRNEDEARTAVARILENNPKYQLALAYDGDRLAMTLARDAG
jgi:hypothetical protein